MCWLYFSDEDGVGDPGADTEEEKELIQYFITTNVQFTSSKMNRFELILSINSLIILTFIISFFIALCVLREVQS